jgi:hypothetical protein
MTPSLVGVRIVRSRLPKPAIPEVRIVPTWAKVNDERGMLASGRVFQHTESAVGPNDMRKIASRY